MKARFLVSLETDHLAQLDTWASSEHRSRSNLVELIVLQALFVHEADGRPAVALDARDEVGRRRTL